MMVSEGKQKIPKQKYLEFPLTPPYWQAGFPPWSGLFDSPRWGEGGGEGVKSVRRTFSDLLGKNLKEDRDGIISMVE
jgi:hypothetical protein